MNPRKPTTIRNIRGLLAAPAHASASSHKLSGLLIAIGALLVALTSSLGGCATTQGGGQSYKALLQNIDRHLDDAVPEMTACFRREFGSEAELLNGRIVVRFEVAGDGLISTLEVLESELVSEAANLCVSDTIRRIYFAEWVGQNPVRLTKPFQFVAGR